MTNGQIAARLRELADHGIFGGGEETRKMLHEATEALQACRDGDASMPVVESKVDKRLYTDCKTLEERAEFFASGRAYETGIVAGPIAMDVARAFFAQSLLGEITYPANMCKDLEE